MKPRLVRLSQIIRDFKSNKLLLVDENFKIKDESRRLLIEALEEIDSELAKLKKTMHELKYKKK